MGPDATAKENSSKSDRRSCIVLGCGDIDFGVASRLKEKGVEVVIVDRDEDKIETLKPTFRAFAGDCGSPEVLRGAGIESAAVVIVTLRGFSEVKRALEAINRAKTKPWAMPFVLALIPHDYAEAEARRLGANDVVPSAQTLADAIVDRAGKLRSRAFTEELIDELSQRDIEETEMLVRWLKKTPGRDIEEIKRLLGEKT
jgi:Trk K+ transport system NAD-binding subunit